MTSLLNSFFSVSTLSQLCLLTTFLFVIWYYVALARKVKMLRNVGPDVVIVTQPLYFYALPTFLLPRHWLNWLLPYRALYIHETLHELFVKTGAKAIGFACPTHAEIFFNDDEVIREFTIKQHENFPKIATDYDVLRNWGENIVSAPTEGYEWKKHRSLCTPAFSTSNLRLAAQVTANECVKMFDKWENQVLHTKEHGEVLNVHLDQDMLHFTLHIIAQAGFGQDLRKSNDDYDKSKFSMSFTDSMAVVSKYLILWMSLKKILALPFWGYNKIGVGFRDFENYVQQMIAAKSLEQKENKSKGEDSEENDGDQPRDEKYYSTRRHDLLSLLIKSRDEDARISLTDEEVFSDAFIFLLAGHETTARAMTWAVALLATNPEEQDRLYEEVTTALGPDKEPTYDDFDKLIYAQAVLKETLRLCPPVWGLGKDCLKPTQLLNYSVTPGMRVSMPIYSIHRNPKYWEQPDKFMPSRFDTRVNPPVSAYSYIPFSIGRRSCLGNRFAQVESSVLLSKLIRQYTIHVPTGTDTKQMFAGQNVMALSPINPIRLWLKKRT